VKSEQFDLFTAGADESGVQMSDGYYGKLETSEHFYQIAETDFAIKLLMQNLMKQTSVSFDTETTTADALTAELIGLSFSWEKGKGFYIPLSDDQQTATNTIEKFRPFFESENIEKVGHNLKYDLKVLSRYGISVKGKLF